MKVKEILICLLFGLTVIIEIIISAIVIKIVTNQIIIRPIDNINNVAKKVSKGRSRKESSGKL